MIEELKNIEEGGIAERKEKRVVERERKIKKGREGNERMIEER